MDTILKMAEAEGKDASALLKQQPFARAGNNKESVSIAIWSENEFLQRDLIRSWNCKDVNRHNLGSN